MKYVRLTQPVTTAHPHRREVSGLDEAIDGHVRDSELASYLSHGKETSSEDARFGPIVILLAHHPRSIASGVCPGQGGYAPLVPVMICSYSRDAGS